MSSRQAPAQLPFGRPTNSTWREHTVASAAQVRTLAAWLTKIDPPTAGDPTSGAGNAVLDAAIAGHLDEAIRIAANRSPILQVSYNGARVERALSHLEAAQVALLRRAPVWFVQSELPNLQAHARQHLPPTDPQRAVIERAARTSPQAAALDEATRMAVVSAYRAACFEARQEFSRVRSFRNILLMSALVLTVLAVVLAAAGWFRPEELRLCFGAPDQVACPTGSEARPWDMLFIESFGLIAAAVSSSAALRHVRGTSTPYGLPLALAVLKLPAGALTAVLGLQLMRGGFVPGLSALDTPAQIVAWAIVFGAAQQLFTGLVDRQAQTVLDDVGGKDGAKDGGKAAGA